MKYKCNNDIKMNIPKDVDFIIKKLEENGYEAFAVGGCVRDTILGREPKDWDITTSALPRYPFAPIASANFTKSTPSSRTVAE